MTPANSRVSRAFLAIEDFARRHARRVLAGAALVFLAGLAISSSLRFETDVMRLLPAHDPIVAGFRDASRTFGALDTLPIMVDAAEGYDAADYEDFADRLGEALRRDPEVASVERVLDADSPLVQYLQAHLPLFLDAQGIEQLRRALSDRAIQAAVRDARRLLAVNPLPEVRELIRRDPLRLSALVLARSGDGRLSQWATAGPSVSMDGRALVILVHPVRPAQDAVGAERLLDRMKETIDSLLSVAARRDPDLPPPRVIIAGRHAMTVEDHGLILGDIATTMSLSFLGVVALYLFCYRRVGAVLYSVVPLLVGQCLTFAIARLLLGTINSATATSAALLMGLGTDFTIVMYARYVEERRAGQDMETASRKMMGETALGVYAGALTSAATFGAMLATSFVGLRQFGFVVGAGILTCLVCVLVLLPALVSAVESSRQRPPRLHVHSFGWERLIVLSRRHPRAVALACLLVTVAAVPLAMRLRMSGSVEDLRSPRNAAVQAQAEIARRFGRDGGQVLVLSRGATADEAMDRAARVADALSGLASAEGPVRRVNSVRQLLPAPSAQEAARHALVSGGADFDPDRIERTLRAAFKAEGLRDEAFGDAIATLRASLRPTEVVDGNGITAHEGGDLLRMFLRRDGQEWAAATRIAGDVDDASLAAIRGADPGAAVAGVAMLSRELKGLIRRDVVRCLVLGLVIVAIVLALDFRSWGLSALALTQLLVGLAWMLGAMGAFGLRLTMVNAFAAVVLLGVGIDYGLHVLHRLRGPDAGDADAVAETGKAVAMAAMTNVVGFGVLCFSNYPGLKGLGLAAVLGTIGCMLTALTLLPALEALTSRRKGAGVPAHPDSATPAARSAEL